MAKKSDNSKSVYEEAKEYYPTYWSKARIDALHDAGKLTKAEYDDIIGG